MKEGRLPIRPATPLSRLPLLLVYRLDKRVWPSGTFHWRPYLRLALKYTFPRARPKPANVGKNGPYPFTVWCPVPTTTSSTANMDGNCARIGRCRHLHRRRQLYKLGFCSFGLSNVFPDFSQPIVVGVSTDISVFTEFSYRHAGFLALFNY